MRYLLILTLLYIQVSFGQNLVQNGGFENGTCPSFASQLNNLDNWNNPTLGTPEFYHQCANQASYVQPPNILVGCHQYPRTGEGYIGLFTYRTNLSNFREYAQNELITPLEAGECYYFEMYVNHAECNDLISDGIGVAFSTNIVNLNSTNLIPLTPDIQNPVGAMISDTLGWTKISGNYIASGGESHLIIGNFRDDNTTTTSSLNLTSSDPTTSYLFIDDVSLTKVSSNLDIGTDTLLCDGESITLAAEVSADTYLWNTGSTDSSIVVDDEGLYTLNISYLGCSFSDEIYVSINSIPSLQWPNDTIVCDNSDFVLKANNTGTNYSYLWQDGSTKPYFQIDLEGLYYCTVSNECGAVTDSMDIKMERCHCSVYVPNSFTPNNDEINDVLLTSSNCELSQFHFEIFDRWGESIFISTDPTIQWDGKLNQVPVANDVYSYVLKYQFVDDLYKEYSGHITVLK